MDKNTLKKYAVWARRELISRVSQKALQYGISEKDCGEANIDSVNGRVLTPNEKSQRNSLIEKINSVGYQEAMEEAAYTWFNRFTALRYMEVNGYLPSHVRVFTDEGNNFKPQIIDEAIHLDIDGLDMDKVYAYKEANDTDELYKYLLITQCNAFGEILPGMFSGISDFTVLLFPDNVLREGSVLEQMISIIPEEDWKDQVQIIGWLYQYYIAEPKDTLINAHKAYKNKEIKFVTQIFTSDWIVKFMVENSLGRMWLDGHDKPEDANWDYYLEVRDQDNIDEQVKKHYSDISPEEISFFDPCMGSGHILVYAFEILMQIYRSQGYLERDAASLILQKNIYGLDIDKRAYQLAYFSLMMKARQYDRRFFTKNIKPNIASFDGLGIIDSSLFDDKMASLVNQFRNSEIYGSLMNIEAVDDLDGITSGFDGVIGLDLNKFEKIIDIYKILSKKYDVVCTNPPYMNSSYMPAPLKEYIQSHYSDYKSDLFSAFIVKTISMTNNYGYTSLLTPYVWWFISSYEKLREYVYSNASFRSLVQLEYNAFEGACVPVGSFVLQKTTQSLPCECIKLSDFKGIEMQAPKTLEAINNPNCNYRYTTKQEAFSKIAGSPVAYWVSDNLFKAFDNPAIQKYFLAIVKGIFTGDNKRFLRLWFEIEDYKINRKWMPYSKGGDFRKWYGNLEYVINWENDAIELKHFDGSGLGSSKYFGKDTIVWTKLTSYKTGFRKNGKNVFFDDASPALVSNTDNINYYLGFLNSIICSSILFIIAPTLNYQCGEIKKLPIIFPKNEQLKLEVENKVDSCIELSKEDWNSYETSWDFMKHPFIRGCTTIQEAYEQWNHECEERFIKLKTNEEELNRIFIEIYGLQDELTPEVDDKDITVRAADLQRDMRSFVSYAVGCMFGRYSLDTEGVAYAGGEWDESKYKSFSADKDNIIPICDNEYFDDDLTGLFVQFVKTVFGEDTLEENLKYIADALGGKGNPRTVIRNYFLNGFFADHCKTYQKRPIYWLFDSGKKNGFKALIYMHRYQPDTIARLRTDYVHEQQSRYRTAIADIEKRISGASGSEAVKLNKELEKLTSQADELITYEEMIHHLADQMIKIDLDDGVKHNYEIFKDVLAKIK